MPLFDQTGWRIPSPSHRTYSNKKTDYYKLNEKINSIEEVFKSSLKYFPSLKDIEFESFLSHLDNLKELISKSDVYRNLLNSPFYPFIIPLNNNKVDIGEQLENYLLPLVEERFKDQFPEFHFKKTIQNNQPLSKKLSVSELSRYQKLIDLNQENIICGFYFPEALSGFDIPSQKQQMRELPAFNDVCLSGSLDICSALIGNPQMLVHKETYSPMICLTALNHADKRITCLFKSYGPHLEFWGLGNQLMPGVDQVSEQWTGGLSFYKVISK